MFWPTKAGQSEKGSIQMAWLTRGANRYYYRRKKVAGKVVSEYIGGGYQAELIAQLEAIERHQAERERQDRRRQAAKEQATDEQIAAFMQVVEEYHKALLLVAGYHQHKRQWRKKRDN